MVALLRRRARWWSARSPTTSPRPTSPPGPRCPGSAPPRAGRRRPGRWPADDLLPERALAGDGHARRQLVEEVYLPAAAGRAAGDTLIETLTAYFEHGSSIEATARALFVHPNTVRYRLRQVADVTGLSATDARDASPSSSRWCSAASRVDGPAIRERADTCL